MLQGPPLGYVNHFVFTLRSFWFSLVFSIISPICLLFGLIGLIINYLIEKYLISQRYSIPEYGGYRLNS